MKRSYSFYRRKEMKKSNETFSVVEYYRANKGYVCGYCQSPNTYFSRKMWAHSLSAQDYQDLIDRGWSRSGQFLYKPIMFLLCCPMYTIKCSAVDFLLSKSQKKTIKRFNRFLAIGDRKANNKDEFQSFGEREAGGRNNGIIKANNPSVLRRDGCSENIKKGKSSVVSSNQVGRPVSKKAKILRLERKKEKLLSNGLSEEEISNKMIKQTTSNEKTLEDLINQPLPENPAHQLKTVLIPCDSPDLLATLHTSWELYVTYQLRIHTKNEDECNFDLFMDFLVKSPLKVEHTEDSPSCGYGTFHEQYWLDNKLVAVGVLDILPKCVSSVYFYYDPDYSDLSFGTYAALREIAYTRSLQQQTPSMRDYYMGYYIESSAKMRYKGMLKPSYLLCPETYTWHTFEEAVQKIKQYKYSRLNDDMNAIDHDGIADISKVLVLYRNLRMTYKMYKTKKTVSNEEFIKEYASIVGMTCARRLLLVQR